MFLNSLSIILFEVGETNLKSEAYTDAFFRDNNHVSDSYILTSGGFISVEIKVAVDRRLLAGGDSLG